jgi:hypothetical protein
MRVRVAVSVLGQWGAILTVTATMLPGAALAQSTPRNQRWDSNYQPPRTATGHPDLAGNWTNVTITPFQREEGREPFYSWDEVHRREGRAEDAIVRRAQPSDPDRPPPSSGNSTGGYNNVYIDRGTNIAVVNGEPRSSLVTTPPNGRIPDLTPIGRQRRAARSAARSNFAAYDHPELRPLGERCIVSFGTSMGPPMIPNAFYNNNYTLVQTDEHVLILAEMVHDYRVIRLGEPNQRLAERVTPWFGDSWGHWEGNTLVVETTNLNPNHPFRGMPPSPETTIHERFTRVDDNTILYEFTVDDPAYTQPWGGEVPFESFDELVYEYACHEGNYALMNIMSGARYQESQQTSGR